MKKKTKKPHGKRDRELDLARQQELFPSYQVERKVMQAEFPFADQTRARPVQQTLFSEFVGRK